MRGKPTGALLQTLQTRNIPAYAGKTSPAKGDQGKRWEHPRVCGENPTMANIKNQICGTSPRMRGKPSLRNIHISNLRNIPAYAGKTGG